MEIRRTKKYFWYFFDIMYFFDINFEEKS